MNDKVSYTESVLAYFKEICKVPRPSKHEEKMIRFLEDFAAIHHLECRTDKAGNVLISKNASLGMESAPGVILQAHMDMVPDKAPGVEHDFLVDPIEPFEQDGWLMAKGTTLGADNGIGIAAALACLANPDLRHGPMECLFTRDEETGLTGAFQLEEGFMKGRYLLNLDSEDEGEIFIGCAGGMDTLGRFTPEAIDTPSGMYHCRLTVTGLKGGHSGDDIDKGRGNAIQILFRLLDAIDRKTPITLTGLDGGNLRNAIAHTAWAAIAIRPEDRHEARLQVNLLSSLIHDELSVSDPGLEVILESCPEAPKCWTRNDFLRLRDLVMAMPHGVMAMSQDVKGLVETSTNLASLKMQEDGTLLISTSQRSSIESAKEYTSQRVASVLRLSQCEVWHTDGYPGWKPVPTSRLLELTVASYEKLFGKKPKVKAIHAGLECGLFLEKYPHLEMVSFGPTLRDVHTPKERMLLETVPLFCSHLLDLLESIGKEQV